MMLILLLCAVGAAVGAGGSSLEEWPAQVVQSISVATVACRQNITVESTATVELEGVHDVWLTIDAEVSLFFFCFFFFFLLFLLSSPLLQENVNWRSVEGFPSPIRYQPGNVTKVTTLWQLRREPRLNAVNLTVALPLPRLVVRLVRLSKCRFLSFFRVFFLRL
jgi:hypothetical protein